MPTNSTGTYSLVSSYFVQNGDTVLPVQHNPVLEDIQSALSNRLMKDGRTVMTGNLKLGGFTVTGSGEPSSASDLMRLSDQAVSDRTAMKALDASVFATIYLREAGREGQFEFIDSDLSTEVSADAEEGIYVAPDSDPTGASGAHRRIVRDGKYSVTWWGSHPDNADNSDNYDAAIAILPDGAEIFWPKLPGVWKGHFVPPAGRSFILRGNKSTLQETLNEKLIFMQGTITENVTTLTADANYGDRVLAMADTSALSAGDLIVLEDDKDRPSDNNLVNQEILRIATVDSGTAVTVEDKVRSTQDSGTRNVHLLTPVIGAEIHDFNAVIDDPRNITADTGLNSQQPFRIDYCDRPVISGCSSQFAYGAGVNLRYAYDYKLLNNRILDGNDTDNGGYGASIYVARKGMTDGLFTRRTRNGCDHHACYDVDIENFDIEDCLYGVSLAHNMYGGSVRIRHGSITKHNNAGVTIATQGITNGYLHVLRDCTVQHVRVATDDAADSGNARYGLYIQTSYANLLVDDLECGYGDAATTPVNDAVMVRINGVCRGQSIIRGIHSPTNYLDNSNLPSGAGWCLAVHLGGTVTGLTSLLIVKDCFNSRGQGVLWGRGLKHVVTENLTMRSNAATAIKTFDTVHSVANVTNTSVGTHSTIN